MPCLILHIGDALQRFELTEGATLGRGEEADLRVVHASISRRHATFHVSDEVTVTDLDSANGTRVDGDDFMGDVTLGDGVQVRFGDVAGWYFDGEPPFDIKRGPQCAVCQWTVEPKQLLQRCPSCGTLYHRDCWQQNGGCGSYGCDQVNAADDFGSADHAAGDLELTDVGTASNHALLLGAAVVGSILGVLTFGLPAAAVSIFAGVRRAVPAAAIGGIGALLGIGVSWWWWLASPV